MPSTLNIPARTFQTGATPVDLAIPVGTNGCTLTLDVTNLSPPTSFNVQLDYSQDNGASWLPLGNTGEMTGPWVDRHGVTHNDNVTTFSLGTKTVNSVDQPTLSQAGWRVRATINVTNGPWASNGGSLALA